MGCSNLCDENTKLKDRVSDLQSAANRVLAERSVEEQELRATVRTLSSELQALQEMNQAHMRDTRRLKSTATELKSSAGGAAWLQAECEGLAREKAHQDGAIAALKQHLSEAEAERDAAKSAQKETERAFTRERDRRRELQDDLKAEQRDRGRDRQPARSPVPQPYAGVDGAGAGLAEKTVKSLREEADALETALRRARAEASEQRAAAAEAQRQKAEWKYKALMARPSAVTCTHCGARVTVWPLAQPALSSEAPPPRRPRCKHQKAMPEPYFQSENSD
ncbi:hypothetical protein DIPPA_22837 [Diplonema papillatum]|nr:hypothetical protein DIPPA_22837 [Diplonema papillatum]